MRCLLPLLCFACSAPPPAPKPVERPPFAGCAAVLDGPKCVLGDAPVRLFLPGKPVAVEGGEIVETVDLDDGVRVSVRASGAFHVETAGKRYAVPVAAGAPDAEFATRRTEALAARTAGQLDDAVKLLADAAPRATTLSDRTKGHLLAAWIALEASDFTRARALLDAVPDLSATWPTGEAFRQVHEAYLASELGDLRKALRGFEAAREHVRRLALTIPHLDRNEALVHVRLGDHATARRLFDAALKRAGPGCDRAEVLGSLGWLDLLAGRTAGARLVEALRLGTDCPASSVGQLHVNLALDAVAGGRFAEADTRLTAAAALPLNAESRAWHLDLVSRVDLGRGEGDRALAAYERLTDVARASAMPELEWRAWVGRARALEALGRTEDAVTAWTEAEAVLYDDGLQVPADQGRLLFLRDRAASARGLVDLLVRSGRAGEAMAAARRARRRVLLGVSGAARVGSLSAEARKRYAKAFARYRQVRAELDRGAADDWRLTREELARAAATRRAQVTAVRHALDETLSSLGRHAAGRDAALRPAVTGETTLAWFQTDSGWLLFREQDGVTVRRLEPDPAEWTLDPEQGPIRLLTEGAAAKVDIHAMLPEATVAYALDLPSTETEVERRRVLLVADPLGDLAAARTEASAVAELVKRGQWGPIERLEDTTATAPAVRAQATGAGLLHYAGHGVFGGAEGWESALPLASGGRLSVGDILTLGPPPRWVVLSGCDTERASASKTLEGLSLARAFVAAGSTAVVAASRRVRDDEALVLMRDFYAGLVVYDEPVRALSAAQRKARRLRPRSDWAAFRAVVP